MLVCPLCRITLAASEPVCPRDGQSGHEVSPHVLVQGLSKRFHVVEPFAHGSTGTLFLADEPETGRRGLLKVLGPAPRALQAERQRLRRELLKQATLEGAYILAPFATGETEGQFWIFREWLEGVSLRVRIARQGALPQAQALSIGAQLAVALDDLHRAGLLHRDLKPGHILLDAQPEGLTRVRVLDAGLCAPITHAGDNTLFGTPGYVAPEQLSGKLVSFRSDLYALGCVLYEMLTGTPAFTGETPDQILHAQKEGRFGALPAGLPEGVSSLLRSLLGKEPQDRPFSAQKLRRTLDPYLPDGAAVTRQPTQTFANVPEPKKAPPREATGTLRPPAASPVVPKSTLLSGSAGPAAARSSAPPPPPAASRPPVSVDSTQRLEIEQILSTSPMQPRMSAPPPPPPRKTSMPPPPPRSSAPYLTARGYPAPSAQQDKTEAIDFAEILDEDEQDDLLPGQANDAAAAPVPSELTQPIRLEQVLAVAEARARRSAAPPVVPDAPSPSAAPEAPKAAPLLAEAPVQVAPAVIGSAAATSEAAPQGSTPVKAVLSAPVPALSAVAPAVAPEVSPVPAALPPFAAPQQTGSDFSLDATIERPAPRLDSAVLAPADDGEPEGDPQEDEATSVSFKPAALSLASQKRTLQGGIAVAAVSAAVSTQQASAQAPSSVVIDETPTLDYERGFAREQKTEARPSTTTHHDARDSDDDTLNGQKAVLFGSPAALRPYAPYAVAAVLLLGVGGALISSLRSDGGGGEETPVAAAAEAAPAATSTKDAVAAAAPTVAALPMAAAPKVEPVPSVAPIVEALPVAPSAAAAEPNSADAERAARSAESPKASSRREQRRDERAAHASKPASKAAVAKPASKSESSEERWAKARQEAQAHYAAKRYKEAAKAYEAAAKNNPTHAGTFAGLGASRLKVNDAKGAVQAYQKAVQLSPNTSGFHAALGRAYATQGDKTKARAAYKRALALDPQNDAAKTALKELG